MFPVLTREQSRELDQKLIAAGVPSLLLMENAGRGAADVILRELPDVDRLLVICGPGNNGGDGLVLARRWLTLGKHVSVHLAGEVDVLSPDARVQWAAYVAAGGQFVGSSELETTFEWAHAIVDALFGTGLSRAIGGERAALIERINRQSKPIVALDLPSGLDANTGQVLGACVQATLTVAFGTPKRGCCTFRGAGFAGRTLAVDIGAPLPIEQLTGRLATLADGDWVARLLLARSRVGHKGSAGHVVVIAGSVGTEGAARLAAHGAFRAGAGVVTIATHPEVSAALSRETWEVMVRAVGPGHEPRLEHWLAKANSVVFGPGVGVSESAAGWLEEVLAHAGVVVLDADGLTLLSANPKLCERRAGELVLTPHPGEAARLLGVTTSQVEADRFAAAEQLCRRFDATVVLKGAPSLIADPVLTHVAPSGHECLATAGSGDVLAGVIGGLAATGLSGSHAALAGTWLHATTGEQLGAAGFAARGLLAREIADRIPALQASLLARRATPWQTSKPS